MSVSDKDGVIVLGNSATLDNNITIKTPTTPNGTLEFYRGVPGNLGALLFKDQDINGSGRVLQVLSNYDEGYTSSSTSYISFNNSTVLFYPKSAASTILVIKTFNVFVPATASINPIAYFKVAELSTPTGGSAWSYYGSSSAGGIGMSGAGVAMLQMLSTNTDVKQFQLQGRRDAAGSYNISAGAIYTTIIEYGN